MDLSKPIPVSFSCSPPSSAVSLLKENLSPSSNPPAQSDLLRSIRATLHGLRSPENESSSIQSVLHWSDELAAEEELTWDAYTLVASVGGVIRKKWDFKPGHQRIQWACAGYIDQPTSIISISSTSPARYTSDLHAGPPPPKDLSERPTFGPFAKIQQETRRDVEPGSRPRAIYVFFRNMGKVFLVNGIEYTFNLPFVTRKAWPMFPHGVLIQRILDSTEIEEANISGDPPLPTIFSFTNPFAEVTAIGLTKKIFGGFRQLPLSLKAPGSEESTSAHERIPPQEVVIWVSQRDAHTTDDLLLTLDVETRVVTLWRYAYIKSEQNPVSREGPDAAMDTGEPENAGMHTASELEMERLRPLFWFERLYQFEVSSSE
jgi:anaphase-promoting complex subunit 1